MVGGLAINQIIKRIEAIKSFEKFSMRGSVQLTKIGRSSFLRTNIVIILFPVGAGTKHEKSKTYLF